MNEEFLLDKIRETDMVSYLGGLGYEPVAIKKDGTDYWYLSPLRTEGTASFHVNLLNNEWYDFGLMAGGNMIAFGLRYYTCSIPELVERFNADRSRLELRVFDASLHEGRLEKESKLVITEVRPLYSYPLKNYLHERSIPLLVAQQFCQEVSYEIGGRSYYGVGFKNDSGGYEIRNKNYKQSSAPKDITRLNFNSSLVNVFEGFMDFLSYQAMHQNMGSERSEFVVLNGAGMLYRALPYLDNFERVGLWLDHDITGRAYTQYALDRSSRYRDESDTYSGFKDLNDWLMHKGTVQKLVPKPAFGLKSG